MNKVREFTRKEFVDGDDFGDLSTTVDLVEQVDPLVMAKCLSILDSNLGPYYEKRQGKDWKVDKYSEMREDGLVYICFYKDKILQLFVSFMVDWDYGRKVVYVYEIQFLPDLRGRKLGTTVMAKLEAVLIRLNLELDLDVEAIALTCFSDNERLLNFYQKNGFVKSDKSPTDRKLRDGRVIKPDHYILIKFLT